MLGYLRRMGSLGVLFAVCTLPVLAALFIEIFISLRRGSIGLDLVAALSMSAALLFGEALAANVVALMYAGGQLLEQFAERLPLLPGAIEAVYTAASAYPVALASGSPKEIIDHVMRLTRLNAVFQHVVYADDMAHGKPAPDVSNRSSNDPEGL